MLTKRKIVSLSLSPKNLSILDQIAKKEDKNRSQIVKELIRAYALQSKWQQIFNWGEQTAKEFAIKSEADVLKLIND